MKLFYLELASDAIMNVLIFFIFWTVFFIFVVFPVINAQYKQTICYALLHAPYQLPIPMSDAIYAYLSANESNMPTEINMPNNQPLIISMWVILGLVVIAGIGGLYYLTKYQGLYWNKHLILYYLITAICVMIVEMAFFLGIATRYSNIMPNDMVNYALGRL